MDSQRSNKGGNGPNKQNHGDSKPTATSIPLAIRFTAGDESIEEILVQPPLGSSLDSSGTTLSNSTDNGRNSLSSSPQLGSDDFSWRKDFLQNSFFHRKRTGSVEGSGGTSPGSSVVSNLSTSAADPNTTGTWKLIKGKVSQAMEDIKSKNSQPMATVSPSTPAIQKDDNNCDTDPETSEEQSNDLSTSKQTKKMQKEVSATDIQSACNDSDFDADAEILDYDTTQVYIPAPVIRKPFASLRSKATASAVKTPAIKQATSTASESKFFRMRRKDKKDNETMLSVPSPTMPKRNIEIESGVEMLEDMILPPSSLAHVEDSHVPLDISENPIDESFEKLPSHGIIPHIEQYSKPSNSEFVLRSPTPMEDLAKDAVDANLSPLCSKEDRTSTTPFQVLKQSFSSVSTSRSIFVAGALLSVLLALPLADFFQGVIVCLLIISLFSWCYELFGALIQRSDILLQYVGIGSNGPERKPFLVPDYRKLPICEVPAVEEHKPLKSYAGWMNEINNYDPSNFHISLTKPVYIRLDGSFLKILTTNVRISRRAIWNEPPIHRRNVKFTGHRIFNLIGCRVEMCPRGLARKRHFSRKYPIQLIIQNKDSLKFDESRFGETSEPTAAVNSSKSDNATNNAAAQDFLQFTHQNSNESNDDPSERQSCDFDFGTTVLHSNLQKLHDNQQKDDSKDTIPYGDETRLLLFARCDREKEDWYRRFCAASVGNVNDQEILNPEIVTISDENIIDATKNAYSTENLEETPVCSDGTATETPKTKKKKSMEIDNDAFEGLLIATNAARITYDYVKFMSLYQSLNSQRKTTDHLKHATNKSNEQPAKQNRRLKKQDDLWKGVEPEIFSGSTTGVVWANVLIGRILYSCLNDQALLVKIQDFLQKKLSTIKLPSFMEDVAIAQTYLGDTPPIIHRISQPLLDERGVWIDADITYEGLMHMTITTKLNLLRLKKQQQQQNHQSQEADGGVGSVISGVDTNRRYNSSEGTLQSEPISAVSNHSSETTKSATILNANASVPADGSPVLGTINSAIYDSDAESSGASSSESEVTAIGSIDQPADLASTSGNASTFYSTPGNSRRLLRIVDRITASNLFQSATEISYIQRAMENMSTKITLRVELKGLVARVVLNLPPPPSDRLWIAFRGPPRLWISAKPAVGDHTFDWSIVTNVIESKLCDEVYKYLVYPNMVDIIAPFLGQSTYKE